MNRWLRAKGCPLWRDEDVMPWSLLDSFAELPLVAFNGSRPVGSLYLIWNDPFFWPHIPTNTSGFIHKLGVTESAKGTGVAAALLNVATRTCLKRGIRWLRLDCSADRPKLMAFYERFGFRMVDRRMIGSFETAFFQMPLDSSEAPESTKT